MSAIGSKHDVNTFQNEADRLAGSNVRSEKAVMRTALRGVEAQLSSAH